MSNDPRKKKQDLPDVRKPSQHAPPGRPSTSPGKGAGTPDTCSSGPEVRDPPPEGTPG